MPEARPIDTTRYGAKFPYLLMTIPAIVPFEVRVGEVPLCVRAITPHDEAALRAGFEKLSPAARYARFRGFTTPSDAQWRYLTHVDGEAHLAIVAVTKDAEIVGVARFVRTLAPGEAEVAFTIADSFRGNRLGSTLLEVLVGLAQARGVTSFVAYTSADNHAMVRLFLARGGAHVSTQQGEAELVLPLRPAEVALPSGAGSSTRAKVVRIAARARLSARRALRLTSLRGVWSWIERKAGARDTAA